MSEEKKEEKENPVEVKIVDQKEPEVTPYDDFEDLEYENMYPTDEQVEEYDKDIQQ